MWTSDNRSKYNRDKLRYTFGVQRRICPKFTAAVRVGNTAKC
jgi:hypothetical protein